MYPLCSPREKELTLTDRGKYVTFAQNTVGQENVIGHYDKSGKIIPLKEKEICDLLGQSDKVAKRFLKKLLKLGMIEFDGKRYSIPFDFCKMVNGYGIRQTVNALRATL